MLLTYYILLAALSLKISNGNRRQKRYLVFTPDTQWGVFATVSVPLQAGSTVSVAWFYEANYYNVANATYFNPLLGDIEWDGRQSRQQRNTDIINPETSLSRTRFYVFIEDMLKQHGFSGRPCLLRSICENASAHFLHNGLIGDLIHLFLTPSSSLSEDLDEDFYEAEYLGMDRDCENYYTNCPENPLDHISMNIKQSI